MSKLCHLICSRHMIISRAVTNREFLSLIILHACTTPFELPSDISTLSATVSLYEYHRLLLYHDTRDSDPGILVGSWIFSFFSWKGVDRPLKAKGTIRRSYRGVHGTVSSSGILSIPVAATTGFMVSRTDPISPLLLPVCLTILDRSIKPIKSTVTDTGIKNWNA